jgi:hypothetical protein
MRTIVTLSALGLTLALGGAAIANPLDRSVGNGNEQMQTYRLHKKFYGHGQAGTDRRDRPALGEASTKVRKPA